MRLRTVSLVLLAAIVGHASAAIAASTLDDLLSEVKNQDAKETQIQAARVAEFLSARDAQGKMLSEAAQKKQLVEKRSQSLSSAFDANEAKLTELNDLLKSRQGNLGELFGVSREVASDVANVLEHSLISVQKPDRVEFLRGLSTAKTLPSAPQLERLWLEMLGEMTEQGRVVRFDSPVIDASGIAKTREVVRIGPFDAVTEGRFLTYLPANGTLTELPRQPPSEYGAAARALERAKTGYVEAPIDPSRGVLLDLYAERPTVIERIQRGQSVGYVIIACGCLGALAAIYQLAFLIRTRYTVNRQLAHLDNPVADNPLGRVLLSFQGDGSDIEEEAEVAELRISEVVLREVPKLERFQALLRLLVAAGPLLGLIGTVIGMIITFQSITEAGTSDPKLMANGIGQAMIATVLGLGVAIPLLFANAILTSLSGQVVQILDEQSAGLLAEKLEQEND